MRSFLVVSLLAFSVACKKKEPEAAPEAAPAETPAATPAPAPAPKAELFGPVVDAVHYTSGGTAVAADQVGAVQKAAEVLKGGDWHVIVVGLADATGDDETNKKISQERADVVAADLVRLSGVESSRVIARGIGEKLATGASQSERKVEFVFYNPNGMNPKEIVMKSGVLEADFRAKQSAN